MLVDGAVFEPVAKSLIQVPSVDMVMLVYKLHADMIGQHAAALRSVRRPNTNLKNMLLDDWAFKTRIVMHDASLLQSRRTTGCQRNRHAGKLAVAYATVQVPRWGR